MRESISRLLDEHFGMRRAIDDNVLNIEKIAELIIECYRNKGKVMVFGNGGSAADAQHFVAELVGRFEKERKGLPALALTTDPSVTTALANDYGFDDVFARQVEAHCEKGDVVVGITTSGSSPNVLKAIEMAKSMHAKTVVFNGRTGGALKGVADAKLLIPGSTARIQEAHILCIHIICSLVEEALFS
jgi:D-sedoheptulose 7-phosphate isomerase